MKEIKIKYLNDDITRLEYIDGKSDWIDLRAAEEVELKAGEFKLIHLGVAMQLPEGYEGDTFKLNVDFTFASTVDLHVNGDTNSYQTDTFKRGVYSSNLANISASDALKDDSACESVELEFNVNDFQYLEFSYSWNLGHRYYINDQKIPLEESDHNGTRSNGKVRTFKLTLDK